MSGEMVVKPGPKIVVAGDVTIDWLQWTVVYNEHNSNGKFNWTIYPGTRMKAEKGGALLLAKMVASALGQGIITHRLDDIKNRPPEKVIHSITLLDAYPITNKDEDKNKKVFRVKEFGGFAGPAEGMLAPFPVIGDDADAGIVVLDDSGNGFRDAPDIWPRAITESGKEPLIIYKMSRPLCKGALWQHPTRNHPDNLIIVINADDLRETGLSISRGLSWEQTAEDFLWQIANNQAIKPLADCCHLVIRFGLDGAIYYQNDGKVSSAKLFYDPGFIKGGFRERHEGDMQGVRAAFVAALALEVAGTGIAGISKGMQDGIRKSRQFFSVGFGKPDGVPAYSIEKIFGASVEAMALVSGALIPPVLEKSYGNRRYWTILEDCTQGKLESIAYNAVRKKEEEALKDVPAARFGKLFTLDRGEIEGLHSIKNLIKDTWARKTWQSPCRSPCSGRPAPVSPSA